jgi:hypothetical protein
MSAPNGRRAGKARCSRNPTNYFFRIGSVPWFSRSAAGRQVMSGAHSALEPPLPIPNRTVKRGRADDSVQLPNAKVGQRQTLPSLKARASARAFSFLAFPLSVCRPFFFGNRPVVRSRRSSILSGRSSVLRTSGRAARGDVCAQDRAGDSLRGAARHNAIMPWRRNTYSLSTHQVTLRRLQTLPHASELRDAQGKKARAPYDVVSFGRPWGC